MIWFSAIKLMITPSQQYAERYKCYTGARNQIQNFLPSLIAHIFVAIVWNSDKEQRSEAKWILLLLQEKMMTGVKCQDIRLFPRPRDRGLIAEILETGSAIHRRDDPFPLTICVPMTVIAPVPVTLKVMVLAS